MILGAILGFAAHWFSLLIDRWQASRQWKLLVRYAIGSGVVASIYFFKTWWKYGLDEAVERLERLLASNVAVGFGVFFGWVAEDLYKDIFE